MSGLSKQTMIHIESIICYNIDIYDFLQLFTNLFIFVVSEINYCLYYESY